MCFYFYFFESERERESESESERVMEDGKRGTVEENIESRREPLLPADGSWRLNLQEFPVLPPRRDERGSFILRRFRRTTGQPSSQILMYICIIFFILFSKVILLFCFLLFLVSFIMARPYFNIEWKFCFFFFFLPRFKTQMQFCSKMLFLLSEFSQSSSLCIYLYMCLLYIWYYAQKGIGFFVFVLACISIKFNEKRSKVKHQEFYDGRATSI